MIPFGTLVVYVTPKGRRYVKRRVEGQDWHSNDGTLVSTEVAQADLGSVVYTNQNVPIQVMEATLYDRLKAGELPEGFDKAIDDLEAHGIRVVDDLNNEIFDEIGDAI